MGNTEVPGQQCRQCGERYLSGPMSEAMEEVPQGKKKSRRKVTIEVPAFTVKV
ncbi:MAG TPA: YgiT-type zinc finger protein [Armatimonadetes bacterium]|nr:YgiT-type zinc finger protein [Armatimonadota bacterium]